MNFILGQCQFWILLHIHTLLVLLVKSPVTFTCQMADWLVRGMEQVCWLNTAYLSLFFFFKKSVSQAFVTSKECAALRVYSDLCFVLLMKLILDSHFTSTLFCDSHLTVMGLALKLSHALFDNEHALHLHTLIRDLSFMKDNSKRTLIHIFIFFCCHTPLGRECILQGWTTAWWQNTGNRACSYVLCLLLSSYVLLTLFSKTWIFCSLFSWQSMPKSFSPSLWINCSL